MEVSVQFYSVLKIETNMTLLTYSKNIEINVDKKARSLLKL